MSRGYYYKNTSPSDAFWTRHTAPLMESAISQITVPTNSAAGVDEVPDGSLVEHGWREAVPEISSQLIRHTLPQYENMVSRFPIKIAYNNY